VSAVIPLVRAIPGFCQPFSSLSHLAAAGIALVAAVPLVKLGRDNRGSRAALAVYAFCVVATLAISGMYHSLAIACSARSVMQHIDHFAIWWLIAGTFTAVHGVMCRGFWRGGVLAIIWTYALIGMLLQICWFKVFSGTAGLVLYLGLGWLGLASVFKLGRQIGFSAVRPILYAGVAFSVGALLEKSGHPILIPRLIGPHEVFHLAVITGVTIHWLFIRNLLVKYAPLGALG
jgi:channel protein (hemolysin III family)